MATLQDLRSWLERDLARFAKIEDHLQEEGSDTDTGRGAKQWKFCFYTDNNGYHFLAIERVDGRNYLGCVSSSRKPRAGEDWHRGRDLADGPLSEETWRRILADIVSYEMVRVHSKEEALRKAEIPNERLYPPVGDATRLTTGAALESRTESASPTGHASSIQIRPGPVRRVETAGAKPTRSRRSPASRRRALG